MRRPTGPRHNDKSAHSSVLRPLYMAVLLLGISSPSQAQSGPTVSPTSGTYDPGQQITFSVTATSGIDTWNSANDYLLFEASPNLNADLGNPGYVCAVHYQPYTYTVILMGNTYPYTPTTGALGSDAVLTNGQCTVYLGGSTAGVPGTYYSMTVTTPVSFMSSYSGTQYLYVGTVLGGQWSPAYNRGSITVTSPTQAEPPSFTPPGGNYPGQQSITIMTATSGATIRYTTDNSTPSETWGIIYSGPVLISGVTTLQAIAYKSGLTDSSVASATYTAGLSSLLNDLTVTDPTLSGNYAANNTVTTAGSVTAASGTTILFQTGNQINLEPGFHATVGSSFHAKLAPPDYILSGAPAPGYNGSVTAGGSTNYNLTATSIYGFTGTIQLANSNFSGLPAGSTASLTNTSLTPAANSSASTSVTIATNSQGQAGSFSPFVSGTSGSLTREANLSLTVNPLYTADFQITASPTSQTTQTNSGTPASYTISVQPLFGFTGTVTLNISGVAPSMTSVFAPNGNISGGSGSATLSIYPGNTGGGTYNLIITGNSGAISHSVTVTLVVNGPILQTVTTSPSNLSFTVDGSSYNTPQTFSWAQNSTHTIAVSNQISGSSGTQYIFANWSDGGTLSHSILVGSSAATYTANFTTQYQLTTAANPSAGGTITPASGWYNSGSNVSIVATSNTGYQFSGFSGALTGTTSPQSLTITGPSTVTGTFTVPSSNYTISGTVKQNTTPLVGVIVNVTGQNPTTTDVNGFYTISVPAGGSYTVTPSSTGHTFCPPLTSFSALAGNQTANFSADLPSREFIHLGTRVVAIVSCGG